MRIKRLIVNKAYGYLDLDFHLNNDISFLVGSNGCGKTTALRLVHAMLIPSVKELYAIPHDKAELYLDDSSKAYVIRSENRSDRIVISVETLNEEVGLPNIGRIDVEMKFDRREGGDEFFANLYLQINDHPVIKFIKSIRTPLFLGLERRQSNDVDLAESSDRRYFTYMQDNRITRARRLFRGSMGESLAETENLVQEAYKQVRRLEEREKSRLRDQILMSSFKVTDRALLFDVHHNVALPEQEQRLRIIEKRNELEAALERIGVEKEKFRGVLDEYYEKLTNVLDYAPVKDRGAGIELEWILNKAQIDRTLALIDVIDEHNLKLQSLYGSVTKFVQAVNSYFSDSHKEIQIDGVGHLVVQRPNTEKVGIDALSSGERQLLIIFSHAVFGRYRNAADVFIIDEPELSLHLGWQENFVSTMLSLNPKIQFIMATHSPEIVGVFKDKAINLKS